MINLGDKIRAIPDFPKPGVTFRDITPLVKHPESLALTIKKLIEPFRHEAIDYVAGMEARGFIFGALAASALQVGFIPLRKPGKLPHQVSSVSYDLEYGSAALEMHVDAIEEHNRLLLVDDLLATGGTARASCELIEQAGGVVVACAFVVELDELGGKDKLDPRRIHSLIHF